MAHNVMSLMSICLDTNCTCFRHHILNYIREGQNEKAKAILEKIENCSEFPSSSRKTLLHYSAKDGNAEMTRYLISKGYNVNAQDYIGHTPLMLSIWSHETATTKILLENNANIYMTGNDGVSSVRLAFDRSVAWSLQDTWESDDSYLISEMISDKLYNDFSLGRLTQFLLNANDSLKFLMVIFGNAEITRFILENGYSIDYCESKLYNFTALHSAITLPRFENAKILMEHGANVDILDKYGCSPLRYYTNKFEDVDENSEVLKNFLRSSSSLFTPGENGLTDLKFLLMFGEKKTVKTILQSEVDVNSAITQDGTLLSVLIRNENADVLNLFDELDIEFDVNARDTNGMTALMYAVRDGCVKKVEFLLQHGADVNKMSSRGSTALSDIAVSLKSRNPDEEFNLLKYTDTLLQCGANPSCAKSDIWSISASSFSNESSDFHSLIITLMEFEDTGPELIRRLFAPNPQAPFYEEVHLCIAQIEEMKRFKVHGTVTLFKLLSERTKKIVGYARNEEFRKAWSTVKENYLPNYQSYYVNILQRRVSRAIEEATLEEKIVPIIEALTGICIHRYHVIVYKIINYLDHQDFENLFQIESLDKNRI